MKLRDGVVIVMAAVTEVLVDAFNASQRYYPTHDSTVLLVSPTHSLHINWSHE